MTNYDFNHIEKQILSLIHKIKAYTTQTETDVVTTEFPSYYSSLIEKFYFSAAVFAAEKFIYLNPAFEKHFGYTLDTLKNRSYTSILTEEKNEIFEKFLTEGSSKIVQPLQYDFQGKTSSGRVFPMKITSFIVEHLNRTYSVVIFHEITERIEILKELKTTHNRFALLIKNLRDAVVIIDDKGKIVDCNTEYQKLVQIEDNVLPDYFSQTPAEWLEREKEMLRQASENQYSDLYEKEIYDSKGERIYVEAQSYLFNKDKNGRAQYLIILRNITKRKKEEALLAQNEALFKTLFEYAPDGMLILDLEEQKFIMANDRICSMLGYSREELLKLSVDNIHPKEALETVKKYIEKQIRKEIITTPHLPVLRKDGSYFYSTVSSCPMTLNGKSCLLGIFRDTTEPHKEEELLKTSEKLYRNMVDVLPEGIIIHSGGKVVFANKAASEIFDKENPESLIGVNPLDFVHPDYRPIVIERIQKSLKENKPAETIEEVFVRKNGEAFNVLVTAVPFRYNDEPAMFVVFRDITETKQNELLRQKIRETEAEQRIKAEFLANLSHEIRNPLSAIIGMNKLLSETNLNEEQREYSQSIDVCSKNLLKILNDILDYSKIENSLPQVQLKPFCLKELLQEIETVYKIRAKEKGLEFRMNLCCDFPHKIVSDENKLSQILNNLIGNALKFTSEGFIELEIRCTQHNKDDRKVFTFAVKDSGIGIKAEDFDRIFKPFGQIENPSILKNVGTGLGLAISRKYAEALGGTLTFESQYGKGSVFSLILPTNYDETAENTEYICNNKLGILKGLRILLVEDDYINRTYLSRFLKKQDAEITEAEDGAKAIELYKPSFYDLILLDGQLPGITGFDVAKTIRESEKNALISTPIIIISGFMPHEHIDKANYWDEYIQKPVNEDELLDKIIRLTKGNIGKQ